MNITQYFDPWSDKNNQPPDMDVVIKQCVDAILNFFGIKTKSPTAHKPGTSGQKNMSQTLITVLIIVATLLITCGVYVVSPAERAVVTRFGRYIITESSGLHWYFRPINTVSIVNVEQISQLNYHAEMLTKDENYVVVDVTVMYRVADPRAYLYAAVNPDESIYQAAASAARQAAGQNTLEKILTTGRGVMRTEIEENINTILDNYKMGIEITDVKLQEAKPPQQVQEAFDDAISAREDEQRFINKAMAYRSEVIPAAKGMAFQMINTAEAYRNRMVQQAKAEATLFKAQLPAYLQNPAVQTTRLRAQMLEKVLTERPKILTTLKNGLTVLPLDKLLEQKEAPSQEATS